MKAFGANFAMFASGVVFAIGLGVSGMTQPQKVIGFLNVVGDWDPSLLLVLMGAVITYFLSFLVIRKFSTPMFMSKFSLPTRRDIDAPLVLGAALFGVGWGIAGYCPGPAMAMVVTGTPSVLIFVLSMTVGMFVFEVLSVRYAEPDGGAGLLQKA
jgi:uncharacterized membrane protein YedE/YeeE